MAHSRCPRSDCLGTSFEMKEITPRGSNFVLASVQCQACGAVVGTMDAANIGHEIDTVKKAVATLDDKVDRIVATVTAIARKR